MKEKGIQREEEKEEKKEEEGAWLMEACLSRIRVALSSAFEKKGTSYFGVNDDRILISS